MQVDNSQADGYFGEIVYGAGEMAPRHNERMKP
jgi:hypothetical protein